MQRCCMKLSETKNDSSPSEKLLIFIKKNSRSIKLNYKIDEKALLYTPKKKEN